MPDIYGNKTQAEEQYEANMRQLRNMLADIPGTKEYEERNRPPPNASYQDLSPEMQDFLKAISSGGIPRELEERLAKEQGAVAGSPWIATETGWGGGNTVQEWINYLASQEGKQWFGSQPWYELQRMTTPQLYYSGGGEKFGDPRIDVMSYPGLPSLRTRAQEQSEKSIAETTQDQFERWLEQRARETGGTTTRTSPVYDERGNVYAYPPSNYRGVGGTEWLPYSPTTEIPKGREPVWETWGQGTLPTRKAIEPYDVWQEKNPTKTQTDWAMENWMEDYKSVRHLTPQMKEDLYWEPTSTYRYKPPTRWLNY